jgi:hypothetical protein
MAYINEQTDRFHSASGRRRLTEGPSGRTDADGTPCGQQNKFSRTACTIDLRGRAKGGRVHNAAVSPWPPDYKNATGRRRLTEGPSGRTDADGTPCGAKTRAFGTACTPDVPFARAKGGRVPNQGRMNGDWEVDGDIYRNYTERHHLKPQKRRDPDGTPCGQKTGTFRTACLPIDRYSGQQKARGGSTTTRMSEGWEVDGDIYRNYTERHHLKPQGRSSSGAWNDTFSSGPYKTRGTTNFDRTVDPVEFDRGQQCGMVTACTPDVPFARARGGEVVNNYSNVSGRRRLTEGPSGRVKPFISGVDPTPYPPVRRTTKGWTGPVIIPKGTARGNTLLDTEEDIINFRTTDTDPTDDVGHYRASGCGDGFCGGRPRPRPFPPKEGRTRAFGTLEWPDQPVPGL